jgi:hypothetical protein
MRSITGQEVYVGLTDGHTTRIGTEWTEVHPRFQTTAITLGCVPEFFEVPEDKEVEKQEASKTIKELVIDGIKRMQADPQDGYFTQEGMPNLKKLSVIVNFAVKREQMIEAMHDMNQQ